MSSEKPRLKYAEFAASKETVSWVIERFIREMNGLDGKPPVRELGGSHRYILRKLQKAAFACKPAADLTRTDIINHCRERQASGVLPQTVNQDMVYLAGALKYAGSAWDECEDVTDAAIVAARPFLKKHRLISKSEPRSRRPAPEELQRLIEFFTEQGKHEQTRIDMVTITRWQVASSRRISETCRIKWSDWDRENYTIIVHKMKDPTNRNKTKRVALPPEAQAILVELWEKRDPSEPRIFPFVAKSCGASYTRAKKALGIVDLHLHDSRRECYTRLVEDAGYSLEEAILVTGHETIAIPQRTYLAMKPENFKLGPKARREAVTAGVLQSLGHLGQLEAATREDPRPVPPELERHRQR